MLRNLDSDQLIAVNSCYKNSLVVAAPGSGKTTVILARVRYLIQVKKVSPENIAVITFTRASAEEMRFRFLGDNRERATPYFGTIHSFIYGILRKHGLHSCIISELECKKILKRCLVKYIDEGIDEIVKILRKDISNYKTSAEEKFTPSIDKEIFNSCYAEYEKIKDENSLWDFDDILLCYKQLLEGDKREIEQTTKRYPYILVDEFQDCDKIQLIIFKYLSTYSSMFCVGDEDQCIYGFRGAYPKALMNFCEDFNYSHKFFLKTNYRCPKNITETSCRIIFNNQLRNHKVINSYNVKDGISKLELCENESNQSTKVTQLIKNSVENGSDSWEDFAILYRTHTDNINIINEFLKQHIPFRIMGECFNLYQHFICRDIISYFKWSLDGTDKESVLKVINKPFRYISKVAIEGLKEKAVKYSCLDTILEDHNMPLFKIKCIKKLQKKLYILKGMMPSAGVYYVLKELGYLEYLDSYCNKIKINITDLMVIVEYLAESLEEFTSLNEALKHVNYSNKVISQSIENKREGVLLSTIHGIKGMEFNKVIIINCCEECIPHKNSIPEHIEEERRLFYVAVTRTRQDLYIYAVKSLRGKGVLVSRFIEEAGIKNC